MRALLLVILLGLVTAPAHAAFALRFDPQMQQWDLSNGAIRAVLRLDRDGHFSLAELDQIASGQTWSAPQGEASSPVLVRMGSKTYDSSTLYSLVDEYTERPNANTVRQGIVLDDLARTARIQLQLELYDGQPVLHRVSITNQQVKAEYVNAVDLLPYSFAADGDSYTLFRVAQWSVAQNQDFQTGQSKLNPNGTAVRLLTGSGGQYCAWMALRDESDRGLFAGWEFDGQARAAARLQRAQEF
jgi:hypothetical protein